MAVVQHMSLEFTKVQARYAYYFKMTLMNSDFPTVALLEVKNVEY